MEVGYQGDPAALSLYIRVRAGTRVRVYKGDRVAIIVEFAVESN